MKRDATWWSEEVKVAMKKKIERYLALRNCRIEKNIAKCYEAKTKTKQAVRQNKRWMRQC